MIMAANIGQMCLQPSSRTSTLVRLRVLLWHTNTFINIQFSIVQPNESEVDASS